MAIALHRGVRFAFPVWHTLSIHLFYSATNNVPDTPPETRRWDGGETRMRVVGVGEVTRYLRDLLEEDYNLQDLWVRGEVTNYTHSSHGHCYFSLKDEM